MVRPDWGNECVNKSVLIEWLRPYLHTGEPILADVLISDIQMMPSTLTPQNEPLTIEELREMGGQPYWHVGLRKESVPPHWNILDPFYAKHIEDYKYGENWLAYRRPPERQEDT